jgi:hypothetical protein
MARRRKDGKMHCGYCDERLDGPYARWDEGSEADEYTVCLRHITDCEIDLDGNVRG